MAGTVRGSTARFPAGSPAGNAGSIHAAGMGYEKAGQAGGMGMQDAYQERGQLQYWADPGAAAGNAGGGGHGAAEI